MVAVDDRLIQRRKRRTGGATTTPRGDGGALGPEPKSRLSAGVAAREFTKDEVQAPYGANEIIYCGYRYDAETQNYFARARYYAPPLGRWLSRDQIGYSGGGNLLASHSG